MASIFSTATSSIQTADRRLALRSHNLANVTTPGFRSRRAELTSVRGGGVTVAATPSDPRTGPVQTTGTRLDLALSGEGYFQVRTPEGLRFTRGGPFTVDGQGRLVDAGGFPLQPEVAVPADASMVSVGGDGTILAVRMDGSSEVLGRIELARIPHPAGLLSEGGNRLAAGPASGRVEVSAPGEAGFGLVISGALPGSNVNFLRESIGRLQDEHFFRIQLLSLKAGDEMLGALLDIGEA